MNFVDEIEQENLQHEQIQQYEEEDEETIKDYQTNQKQTYSFKYLGLRLDLLRGILSFGLQKFSEFQKQFILSIVKGGDSIIQTQLETEKTLTFLISTLQLIDTSLTHTQALILCPNSKVAQKIIELAMYLGEYLPVSAYACTDRTDPKVDLKKLKQGVQIVVGTPLKVLDLVQRGILTLDHVKIFILDQVEEMLGRGLKQQIYKIFYRLPQQTQIVLFSETMNPDILEISKQFMKVPLNIPVKKNDLIIDDIKQFFIALDREEWKFDTFMELYQSTKFTKCVVYCNTSNIVDEVAQKLNNYQISIPSIHENMQQNEINLILDDFRKGKTNILITTDFLSRVIDDYQVNFIINYDLPKKISVLLQRTGRYINSYQKLVAVHFVTPTNVKFLKEAEKYFDVLFEECPLDISNIFD